MLYYGFRAGHHYISIEEPIKQYAVPFFQPKDVSRGMYFRNLLVERNGVNPNDVHVFYKGEEVA